MMRALFLQHEPGSLPGIVGEALADRGFEISVLEMAKSMDDPTFTGEFPDLTDVDLLLPMGSIWSVYDDEHLETWIGRELDMLRTADADGTPVWGICFGAQALAAAHGGQVVRSGIPELGFSEIDTLDDERVPSGPWMQWHYDVFTVPDDAELLATTDAGPQVFTLRKNLATQFHPEVDVSMIDVWESQSPEATAEATAEAGTSMDQLRADAGENHDRARADIDKILDWWLLSVGLG
jgi:GMP synthase-like glutamine amidotransferase